MDFIFQWPLSLLMALVFAWQPATAISAEAAYAPRPMQECSSPFAVKAQPILNNDFPNGLTLQTMQELMEKMLQSGKRLEYRGYRKNGTYLVPHMSTNESGKKTPEATLEFPEYVVDAIKAHASEAIAKGYAKFPFMADFGHGHIMIPDEAFAILDARKDYTTVLALNEALRQRNFKILYHASENLEYKGDEKVRHLRKNRNIVGEIKDGFGIHVMQGSGAPNTASNIPGMHEIAIVYLSIASSGCVPFQYENKSMFLDLSTTGPTSIAPPPTDGE